MTARGLRVEDLVVRFGHGRGAREVLHRVSLDVAHGRTVGLVGESGSGKSTIGKAIVGTVPVASGRILVDGHDLAAMSGRQRAAMHRKVQMIPQDPYSSLNPRRTIGQTLAEAADPVRAGVRQHRDLIGDWLDRVKLAPESAGRYPHEFSGGQRQRVAIARALMIEPEIVIADEVTSALDVSVQAEVLALLENLRETLDLTMVFISHNLAVVRRVCDEVVVLCRGDVVETADRESLFRRPSHEYTRELLSAVPGSPTFSLSE
ncbi:ATP-binding cassette domain-containing protein [Amycolatopsis sp. NPDC004079]|uniref:ABC transporter ATP-binding protein n=1 Tax=Amycolatopsis sp. NPDC004079 TaxID=3154549 RepID=UPI00339ED36E